MRVLAAALILTDVVEAPPSPRTGLLKASMSAAAESGRQGGVPFVELQRWRLIACVAWALPCYCVALSLVSVPSLFPAGFFSTLLLLLAPYAVLLAQKEAIAIEVSPLPQAADVVKQLVGDTSSLLRGLRGGKGQAVKKSTAADPKKTDNLPVAKRSALVELFQGASRRWLVVYIAAAAGGFCTSVYVSARSSKLSLVVPIQVRKAL